MKIVKCSKKYCQEEAKFMLRVRKFRLKPYCLKHYFELKDNRTKRDEIRKIGSVAA